MTNVTPIRALFVGTPLPEGLPFEVVAADHHPGGIDNWAHNAHEKGADAVLFAPGMGYGRVIISQFRHMDEAVLRMAWYEMQDGQPAPIHIPGLSVTVRAMSRAEDLLAAMQPADAAALAASFFIPNLVGVLSGKTDTPDAIARKLRNLMMKHSVYPGTIRPIIKAMFVDPIAALMVYNHVDGNASQMAYFLEAVTPARVQADDETAKAVLEMLFENREKAEGKGEDAK